MIRNDTLMGVILHEKDCIVLSVYVYEHMVHIVKKILYTRYMKINNLQNQC